MCLLAVAFQESATTPLFVAANRDERYDRPTTPITVLKASPPRVIGGRDELAGGTWLAVNEDGVVAALTNRPVLSGRDPMKRSRGELPLRLASFTSARDAAADFQRAVDPSDYNPCWILVGDRNTLFYIDLSGGDDHARVTELGPGLHVLENRPLGAPSSKVDRVRALWTASVSPGSLPDLATVAALLGDHLLTIGQPSPGSLLTEEEQVMHERRRPHSAICVHTPTYGTRSSAIISVPADAVKRPTMHVASGPTCTSPFVDESWRLDPD